jgi:hypothetical protein
MRKVLAFALMLCIGMVFGCGDTGKKIDKSKDVKTTTTEKSTTTEKTPDNKPK